MFLHAILILVEIGEKALFGLEKYRPSYNQFGMKKCAHHFRTQTILS